MMTQRMPLMAVTVDIVLWSCDDGGLKVLLIRYQIL
jgi:hypothetical protein